MKIIFQYFTIMKYLIIITIITLAVAAPRDQITDKIRKVGFVQMYLIESLKSMFRATDPAAELEYETAVDKVYNCLTDLKKTKTFCDTFTNHFAICAKPLMEDLEKYLRHSNREDVPATIISSLQSTFGYICRTDGEHILEFVNPCILKAMRSSRTCTEESNKRVEAIHRNHTIKVIPATCNEGKILRNTCLKPEIEKACGNPITRDSSADLLEAIFKPCSTV